MSLLWRVAILTALWVVAILAVLIVIVKFSR
jgi:hypothetical protein